MKAKIISCCILFFASCITEEEVNTNITSELLDNGKLITVCKTEKTATSIGAITHKNYGSTYSFTYEFTIEKNDVVWKNKGSAVPKNIIFLGDTTFVKYRQKKSIAYTNKTKDTIVTTKYRDTIVNKQEAFIDKRYFFNLLGDTFWTTIPDSLYNSKKVNYKEYNIPNDNDLELLVKKEVQ